jgi:hypothetical protein
MKSITIAKSLTCLLILGIACSFPGCATVEQRPLNRQVLFAKTPVAPDASQLEASLDRLHANLESFFGQNLVGLYATHAVLNIPDGETLSRYDHLELRSPVPKLRRIEIVFNNLSGCEIQILKSPRAKQPEAVLVLQQSTGYSGSLMGYGGDIIRADKGLETLKTIAEDLLVLSNSLKEVTLTSGV